MDQLQNLVEKLESIAEELNETAMQILSNAIEAGDKERPLLEKKVSQARRAVEKAIHHLSATSTD